MNDTLTHCLPSDFHIIKWRKEVQNRSSKSATKIMLGMNLKHINFDNGSFTHNIYRHHFSALPHEKKKKQLSPANSEPQKMKMMRAKIKVTNSLFFNFQNKLTVSNMKNGRRNSITTSSVEMEKRLYMYTRKKKTRKEHTCIIKLT